MALVYIDREVNYGNAENMLVFDLEALSDYDIKNLNETLDKGESLWGWVFGVQIDGKKLNSPFYEVEKSVSLGSRGITLKYVEEARKLGIIK